MALKYLYAPSGVKAGTAYGVLPNSASADFSSFVSDTDGTRVDENGFITDVEANVPRLDYTGGGCPSLLLEPQSTNLITYSEDFSEWNNNGGTLTPNASVSPSGENNAYKYNTDGAYRIFRNLVTLNTSTNYTFTFYAKNIDAANAYYRVYNNTNGSDVISVTNYISQINTSTWTRIEVNFTTDASGAEYAVYLMSGNSDGNILFWGAQLENQSYATSYIPNYGTAAGVTRSADLGGSTGDISSAINEEEGVLFAYMAAPTSEAIVIPQWIILSEDSSTNSFISIRYSNAGDSMQVRYRANGGTAVQITTTSVDRTNFNKIAFRWKENDFSLWINGVLITTQTTLDIITANNLNKFKFANASGGQNLFGKVREIRIYDEYESDAEMVKLTTL